MVTRATTGRASTHEKRTGWMQAVQNIHSRAAGLRAHRTSRPGQPGERGPRHLPPVRPTLVRWGTTEGARLSPPPFEWREHDAPQERAPPREYSKGTTRWRGDRRSGTHSITATLAGHYRGGLHYPFVRGFPRVHNFGSFEIYTVPKFPQRTGNRDLVFAPRHLLIAPFVLHLVVKNY